MTFHGLASNLNYVAQRTPPLPYFRGATQCSVKQMSTSSQLRDGAAIANMADSHVPAALDDPYDIKTLEIRLRGLPPEHRHDIEIQFFEDFGKKCDIWVKNIQLDVEKLKQDIEIDEVRRREARARFERIRQLTLGVARKKSKPVVSKHIVKVKFTKRDVLKHILSLPARPAKEKQGE